MSKYVCVTLPNPHTAFPAYHPQPGARVPHHNDVILQPDSLLVIDWKMELI